MTIEEYTNEIVRVLKEEHPDHNIEARIITKTNDIDYHGISIELNESEEKHAKIAATVYTDGFFDNLETYPVEVAAEHIWESYEGSNNKDRADNIHDITSMFSDFEKAKERIVFRLLNKNKNKAIMNNCPYVDFGDLIACFVMYCPSESLGYAHIKVTNSHMNSWGVTIDQLKSVATINTRKLCPINVIPMEDLLKEMMQKSNDFSLIKDIDLDIPSGLYILTTPNRINGSIAMADLNALSYIADNMEDMEQFYILPSSIHEVLAFSVKYGQEAKDLLVMVKDINQSCVSNDEVLADNVYLYDNSTKELTDVDGNILPFIMT